jgi:hypothetical protein
MISKEFGTSTTEIMLGLLSVCVISDVFTGDAYDLKRIRHLCR